MGDEISESDTADVVVQSEAEALNADLVLIAESRGWTLEDSRANHVAADAVGRIAQIVAEERPEIFVGSALSEEPDNAPTLYIKGPRDAFIDELVRSSGVPIVVADNQPFSFAELEARQQRVHEALLKLSNDVVTSFGVERGGIVEVAVTRSDRLPDQAAVLDAIPADLRAAVEVDVVETPVVEPEAAYGGMTLLRTGIPDCTSGWTVQKVSGTTRGISGAALCSGMDQVTHPGHAHGLNLQGAHEGQWGDVEWYTTTQIEADDFYADVNLIRDVVSVEPRAAITQGEHVCAFGRGSNSRDCNLTVRAVSVGCGSGSRLVQMSGDTQIGGDSGGPWYNTHVAFGAHFGDCDTAFDMFTPADLFDEALAVRVATN